MEPRKQLLICKLPYFWLVGFNKTYCLLTPHTLSPFPCPLPPPSLEMEILTSSLFWKLGRRLNDPLPPCLYIIILHCLSISISLLYPKESFTSNFKTARKKSFFQWSNFQLIPVCYYVNKIVIFQSINKSLFFNLIIKFKQKI